MPLLPESAIILRAAFVAATNLHEQSTGVVESSSYGLLAISYYIGCGTDVVATLAFAS